MDGEMQEGFWTCVSRCGECPALLLVYAKDCAKESVVCLQFDDRVMTYATAHALLLQPATATVYCLLSQLYRSPQTSPASHHSHHSNPIHSHNGQAQEDVQARQGAGARVSHNPGLVHSIADNIRFSGPASNLICGCYSHIGTARRCSADYKLW